jgi:predicted dehydrogenase
MGKGNLGALARHCNVVGLCDVDLRKDAGVRFRVSKKGHADLVTAAPQLYPGCKVYQDFRRMLIEMDDKIDAVGVATHDSTHFAVACMALQMGKHVFVQKPLAHSVYEIRTLREIANKNKLVTQMGNQGHAFEGMRLVKEWYQAGLIGEVKEVIAWTNRPAGGFGFKRLKNKTYPPVVEVPEGLDWDGWLGPVDKEVGYDKDLHPKNWRAWWDFGCGGLGDIGCHTIDVPFWALDLSCPTKVEAEVEEVNPIQTPMGSVVTYHFPARPSQPPVTLKWYEGPKMPPKPEVMGDVEMNKEGGMIMLGSKGAIYHPGMRPDSPRLLPDSMWQEYRANPDNRVPKTLPRVGDITTDWVEGITEGTTPCSNFDYAVPLTEVIVLGTMAIRTGKTIEWDPKAVKVTNDNPEAQALVNVPARDGWRTEDLTKAAAGKFVKS